MKSQRLIFDIGIVANALLVIIFFTAPLYTHRSKLPICNRFDVMGPVARREFAAVLSMVTIGSAVLLFLACITVCRKKNSELVWLVSAYLAILAFTIEVNINRTSPTGVPGDDNYWLHKVMTLLLIASVAVIVACMVNRTGQFQLHLVTVLCIGVVLFTLSQWYMDKKWVTEESYGWNAIYYVVGANLLLPLYALVTLRAKLDYADV